MGGDILEQLFDSPIKFKLLKFFIRNSEDYFNPQEICERIQLRSGAAKPHIAKLVVVGFLTAKNLKGKKSYCPNKKFIFYQELKNLILKSSPISHGKLLLMMRNLGNIKLAVVSGIFLSEENSRIDLLLVGTIKSKNFKNFIKRLEAIAGTAIRYSIMAPKEFDYRYDMYDKFLRDVLEYRHEKLINKLKL